MLQLALLFELDRLASRFMAHLHDACGNRVPRARCIFTLHVNVVLVPLNRIYVLLSFRAILNAVVKFTFELLDDGHDFLENTHGTIGLFARAQPATFVLWILSPFVVPLVDQTIL